MMDSATNSHCNVCRNEFYKLETSPKCLTCGHIFCSSCVANLTTTKIKCPDCHAAISILTAEDIDSINHTINKHSYCSASTVVIGETASSSSSSSLKEETSLANQETCVHGHELEFSGNSSTDASHIHQNNGITITTAYVLSDIHTNDHTATTADESINSSPNQSRSKDNESFVDQIKTLMVNSVSDEDIVLHSSSYEADENTDNKPIHSMSSTVRKISDVPIMSVDKENTYGNNTTGGVFKSALNQEFSDKGSDCTKESAVVHHSDTCDLEHLIPTPDISRRPSTTEENFVEIKENEVQRFTDQLVILHEVMETVDDAILTLQVEKEHHEKGKENLKTRIQEEEQKIESSILKIEEAKRNKISVQEVTDALKEKEEEVSKASTLVSLRESIKESSTILEAAEELGTAVEVHYMQLLLSRDVPKPEYLERMIDLGETVYAEHLVNGESRWAKISLVENKLHLHALEPTPPTENSKILSWKCLRNMISPAKAMTFMDIEVVGGTKERIYFTMFDDTPRAQQFVILSSGEHRYCYRNTKMKQRGNPDEPAEYISFHGPKNPKGASIRGVVQGIIQGGVYTRTKISGLLAGAALSHRQRTLFIIYLQPDLDEFTTGAFGEVTQGLDFLRKVSKHEPVQDVSVVDCGLVVQLIHSTH